MPVIVDVCSKEGHEVRSVIFKDVVDPMSKVVVHQYEMICVKCGHDLAFIKNFKPSNRGGARPRKAKPDGNNNHAAQTPGAGQAANQAANPQPVHRSELVMPEPGV